MLDFATKYMTGSLLGQDDNHWCRSAVDIVYCIVYYTQDVMTFVEGYEETVDVFIACYVVEY